MGRGVQVVPQPLFGRSRTPLRVEQIRPALAVLWVEPGHAMDHLGHACVVAAAGHVGHGAAVAVAGHRVDGCHLLEAQV